MSHSHDHSHGPLGDADTLGHLACVIAAQRKHLIDAYEQLEDARVLLAKADREIEDIKAINEKFRAELWEHGVHYTGLAEYE